MNTIIIYESTHHGNTKKLVDAIVEKCGVRAVSVEQAKDVDLNAFDTIGFASGVAFGKFYKAIETFAIEKLPEGKSVFFIYTSGSGGNKFASNIKKTAASKNCKILGEYGCLGYDTFGPFKLVGGIAKGHPTQKEIDGAVEFYARISKV